MHRFAPESERPVRHSTLIGSILKHAASWLPCRFDLAGCYHATSHVALGRSTCAVKNAMSSCAKRIVDSI
jgi:hypothetical protein